MKAESGKNPPSSPGPDIFSRLSTWTARAAGGRWGFISALAVVVLWLVSGPFFHYSDQWQLVINTGTTIITFLMVFLIQNAQNRESKAVHLKLDELIRAMKTARNEMIDIENMTEDHLDLLISRYHQLGEAHRKLHEAREKGKASAGQLVETGGKSNGH